MEDHTFIVGQEFPDVKSFRSAIKEAAIAQHFELRIIKSDLIRYFAKCAVEDCPWRIRAVKLPNVPTFTIRSISGTHTCGKKAENGHHQASVDWIVSFIEERLRDNINYKPKDILHDINKQYGISLPYKQAWRAKERGLQEIYGSSEEGYFLLPAYCDQIKTTNPGSIADLSINGADNRFQRLFVCFYASIYGFLNGCLPIISLGAIHLKSKYLGTLLSATSYDADGGLFPLAFSVVDVEDDESWMWFLSKLYKSLEMNSNTVPQLTFLSHGQKGIIHAVKRTFPTSYPAICMRHMSETMSKEFKNSRLVHLLWKAAFSTTTIGFKKKMTEIENICPDAANWLQQFPPSSWALIYFEGKRYGCLSSNIYDFNKWILEARELPIAQIVERIHAKMMAEFQERLTTSMSWFSLLAPSAEQRIMEAVNLASSYQVLRSDEVEFEVISAERSEIVNIDTRSCSCCDWQMNGIPCSHAAAALLSSRKDIYAFTEKYFTASYYREAYIETIHPLPCKTEQPKNAIPCLDDDTPVVRPPKFRRPPGRPENKRMRIDDLNHEKHTVHCSQCNQTGHYKTTCKSEARKSTEQL